ncbi:MAG: hypothetical protein Q7W16_07465 [Coriobacteriia bacterium]|nr:hypothetical protein [Coriobacteriia bacterium]
MAQDRIGASERWRRLAVDVAIGIALAALVLLVVLFAGQAAPSFVYEMF